jgi:serine/threonine-protein kinase
MVARFIDEARITGQLDHPGIVPVHEIAVDARGAVYFTMPLVRGRDLRAIFALARTGREGWNLTRAVGVILKVCETVAFAHVKGVVHRDLKPANIMVGPFGEAYVMDWGLALVLGRAEGRRVVGTPAYMAPEQAKPDPGRVGPRSDVYSLGAILYELLTGRMPHEASLEARREPGSLDDVLTLPPRATLDAAPEAPRELAAICDTAMQPAPEARYETASARADDLRAWLEGLVVRAYESGALPRLRKWVHRNRGLAAALQAFVGLAILSGVAVITLQNSKLRAIAAESYTANVQAAALSLRMNETAQAKHLSHGGREGSPRLGEDDPPGLRRRADRVSLSGRRWAAPSGRSRLVSSAARCATRCARPSTTSGSSVRSSACGPIATAISSSS